MTPSMRLATILTLTLLLHSIQNSYILTLNNVPAPQNEVFMNSKIENVQILQGESVSVDKKTVHILTFSGKHHDGCNRYDKSDVTRKLPGVEDPQFAILLQDNTKCSLSTKIHFAQLSGADVLLLSYVDENIQEAEVDLASFSGVDIPVLLVKKSHADLLFKINEDPKFPNIELDVEYKKDRLIPGDADKLMVFMSSQPIDNPVIEFLADLRRHQKLMGNKELEIIFSVGFCTSCKDKGYLEKASRCLSGGKYCAINSIFKTDELVKETLRQICIRNYYGNNKLILYLEHLNKLAKKEIGETYNIINFDESRLNHMAEDAMRETHIKIKNISECFLDSFIKRDTNSNSLITGAKRHRDIDIYFDDNSLLQKEQQRFLQVTKFNIFPLIIIDDVLYTSRINLKSFIGFACKKGLLYCEGFNKMKQVFFNSLLVICIIFLMVIVFICKKNIEKKMRKLMTIKFHKAMNKYYKLRGENTEADTLGTRDRHSKRKGFSNWKWRTDLWDWTRRRRRHQRRTTV
jgi:hypothetical protein